MSTIQFRVYEVTAPLERNFLLDIFHLGNLRLTTRNNTNNIQWYDDKSILYDIEQDYYEPIEAGEVLSEYMIDKENSDGFIIYLNIDEKPRSYKKANKWLNDILSSHIEIIDEMGWKSELFLGKNPQKWVSKKFINHVKRLNISVRYINNSNEIQALLA